MQCNAIQFVLNWKREIRRDRNGKMLPKPFNFPVSTNRTHIDPAGLAEGQSGAAEPTRKQLLSVQHQGLHRHGRRRPKQAHRLPRQPHRRVLLPDPGRHAAQGCRWRRLCRREHPRGRHVPTPRKHPPQPGALCQYHRNRGRTAAPCRRERYFPHARTH